MPLSERALIELVLDGKYEDGERATDEERAYGLELAREYDPGLHALLVRAWRGETEDGEPVEWEERSKALDALAKRASGPVEDPIDDASIAAIERLTEVEGFAGATTREEQRRRGEAAGARPRTRSSGTRSSAVRVIGPDGERWASLGSDEAAIRDFFEDLVGSADDVNALIEPFPPGRPSELDRLRYEALAAAVSQAVARGATQAAVGKVIGRGPPRVAELARRGDGLGSR